MNQAVTEVISEFGTLPKIADHDGILICLDVKREKVPNRTKTIYDYRNVDSDALITYIKNIDFENEVFCNDVLKQTEFFSNVLITALNKFVPKKTLCVQPDTPAWSNTYTCLLLRKKNRNYCLFKKASCKLANAILNPLINDDYITILQTKKYKTQQQLMNP